MTGYRIYKTSQAVAMITGTHAIVYADDAEKARASTGPYGFSTAWQGPPQRPHSPRSFPLLDLGQDRGYR
jgi:hypothetical protein